MMITLLTDFGTKDYYAAAMEGAILSVNEKARIIDITHEIAPQDVLAAGFTLRACYRDFPRQTIHVAVVDPGVGSPRRAVLVETEDYRFLAPDNGLLSFVYENEKNFRVFKITNEQFFRQPVSRTFHGRDVFAPVAAHLSAGIAPEKFGERIEDFVTVTNEAPRRIAENRIEARIIYIDRFGNLVTNLRASDLPEKFALEINGTEIKQLKNFYAEAETDEVFMIWGSAGFLEIAAFRASAKNLLKADAGHGVLVKRLGEFNL